HINQVKRDFMAHFLAVDAVIDSKVSPEIGFKLLGVSGCVFINDFLIGLCAGNIDRSISPPSCSGQVCTQTDQPSANFKFFGHIECRSGSAPLILPLWSIEKTRG